MDTIIFVITDFATCIWEPIQIILDIHGLCRVCVERGRIATGYRICDHEINKNVDYNEPQNTKN